MKGSALSSSRKIWISCMKALMYLCSGLTGALVLFLMGYVLIKGIPNITWELLSTSPSYLSDRIGILPDLLNTVYIVIATLLIVLPVGVGSAIYLTEYAANKRLVAMIEYAHIGIAVANAMEVLKEKADYITKSNDEDGPAIVLKKILEK